MLHLAQVTLDHYHPPVIEAGFSRQVYPASFLHFLS